MISHIRRFFACTLFENQLLKADGQAFEDIFCNLMETIHPSFQKVRPHGNVGDRKNDGFIQETGDFFVLYGPENLQKSGTISKARQKIKDDVDGLIEYWPSNNFIIKNVKVTINDKGKGLQPDVLEVINELDLKYDAISIAPNTYRNIIDSFRSIDEIDSIQKVLGGIVPSDEELGDIRFEALNKIVQHLQSAYPEIDLREKDGWKKFDDKIKINDITQTEHLLRAGSHCVGSIEDFIRNNVSYQIGALRDIFAAIYEESKVSISEDMENYSDKRFMYILDKASPERKTRAIQDGVIGLMAYFFEKCDIFESGVNPTK